MRHGFMPDYLPSTVVVDAERRHRLTASERDGRPVRRRRPLNVFARLGGWVGRHRSTIGPARHPGPKTATRYRLHH